MNTTSYIESIRNAFAGNGAGTGAIFEYLTALLNIQSLDALLAKIVHDIPLIVNGLDCSVYLLPEFLGDRFDGSLVEGPAHEEIDASELQGEFIVLAGTSRQSLSHLIGKAFYRKGEGLTGWIFQHGNALFIDDMSDPDEIAKIDSGLSWVDKYRGSQEQFGAAGKKPFLGIPLKGAEGEIFGVLKVPESPNGMGFPDFLESLMTSFASLLSGMIQRNKLIADRETQLEDLMKLGSTTDKESLLSGIAQTAMRLVDGRQCALFFLSEEDDEQRFYLRATAGKPNFLEKEVGVLFYKKGEGATGWIAKHGKSLNIRDITDNDELQAIAGDLQWIDKGGEFERDPEHPRAYLGVPLISTRDNKVIGVIRVPAHRLKTEFSKNDEERLVTFAKYVVLVIEKANLLEERELLANELFKLSEATDDSQIYEAMINVVPRILYASHCSVFRVDVSHSYLILRATTSPVLQSKIGELYYKIGEGFTGWVAKCGRPLQINDVCDEQEVRRFSPDLKTSNKPLEYPRREVGSYLAVPIKNAHGKILGVIRLLRRKAIGSEPFNPGEERILNMLANHLSLVIERAKKFEMQKEHIKKLLEIGRTLDLPTLLRLVVNEANAIISGNGCSIFLKDLRTERYYLRATSDSSVMEFKRRVNRLYYVSGEGKTGTVIARGTPLLLNKIKAPLRRESKHDIICETGDRDAQKFLAVPIKDNRNEVIGVIRIPRTDADLDFQPADQQLLESMANQVGLVIKNSQLFQEQEHRVKALETISKLNGHLQHIDPEKPIAEVKERIHFLALTCLSVEDGLGFNRAIMFEYDNVADVFYGAMGIGQCRAVDAHEIWAKPEARRFDDIVDRFSTRGFQTSLFNERVKRLRYTHASRIAGAGLPASVLNSKEPCVIKNGKLWGKREVEIDRAFLDLIEDPTFALVPLVGRHGIYGAIYGDNKHNGAPIKAEEVHLVEIIANQVAIAIENARLIAEIQARNEEEKRHLDETAHALRTPLQPMLSGIEELRYNRPKTDAERKKLIEIIAKNIYNANQLSNNILYTSQVKMGVLSTSRQEIDLRELCNELYDLFRLHAKSKDLKMSRPRFELQEPRSYCDERKLKLALQNLISNAIEFSREGGCVTMAVRRKNGKVIFEITNEGLPLPQQNREKIFEIYQKDKNSRGAGLGLFITKNIAELMNGGITAESTGALTRFKLWIPA